MIEILIGTIASGKSTYAKQRAEQGAIIVNDDAIVNALHANNYLLYRKDLKILYKILENDIVTCSTMLGLDVVIDRPNCTVENRKRFIGLAKAFDTKVIAVVFPFNSAEEHANRRIQHDGRGYTKEQWQNVAQRHRDQYTGPSLNEGFDEIKYIGE